MNNERVHLRLASSNSVKRETHKYVIIILVGSFGMYGKRKSAPLNEKSRLTKTILKETPTYHVFIQVALDILSNNKYFPI